MSNALTKLVLEAQVLAGAAHPCSIFGHKWVYRGGAPCGCEDGQCSVPVHECVACGDWDYGESEEAEEIRAECDEFREEEALANEVRMCDEY